MKDDVTELKVFNMTYSFSTEGEIEFVNLTDKVQEAVSKSLVRNGLVHVFAPHATGIIILTENDYALLSDIKTMLEALVPRNEAYSHPSNAHAHLRSVLLQPDRRLVRYRTGYILIPIRETTGSMCPKRREANDMEEGDA